MTDTRQRLLDATRRCISAKGLAATTSRDITAEAAANLAAITYHFGSKDELVAEALLEHVAPDDLLSHALGQRVVTGPVELVGRITEDEVGPAHQLVELVEVTTGPFEPLEGLAEGAAGLDGGVVDPLGS